ncbi:hypothetical protein Hanom_Chr01g00037631 [Helianthus anomalus]
MSIYWLIDFRQMEGEFALNMEVFWLNGIPSHLPVKDRLLGINNLKSKLLSPALQSAFSSLTSQIQLAGEKPVQRRLLICFLARL